VANVKPWKLLDLLFHLFSRPLSLRTVSAVSRPAIASDIASAIVPQGPFFATSLIERGSINQDGRQVCRVEGQE
jgi:hypothetical protein